MSSQFVIQIVGALYITTGKIQVSAGGYVSGIVDINVGTELIIASPFSFTISATAYGPGSLTVISSGNLNFNGLYNVTGVMNMQNGAGCFCTGSRVYNLNLLEVAGVLDFRATQTAFITVIILQGGFLNVYNNSVIDQVVTVNVSAGYLGIFNTSSVNLGGTSIIISGGSFEILKNASVSLSGSTAHLTGGSWTIYPNSLIPANAQITLLKIDGGVFTPNSGVAINITNWEMNGGSRAGSDILYVLQNMTWSGGNLTSTGKTIVINFLVILPSVIPKICDYSHQLVGQLWVIWNAATTVSVGDNALIVIQPTATLQIGAAAILNYIRVPPPTTSWPFLINYGTIQVTVGFTFTVQVGLINAGFLDVYGTALIASMGNSSGIITAQVGGRVSFTATFTLLGSSATYGYGVVNCNGGVLTIYGYIHTPGQLSSTNAGVVQLSTGGFLNNSNVAVDTNGTITLEPLSTVTVVTVIYADNQGWIFVQGPVNSFYVSGLVNGNIQFMGGCVVQNLYVRNITGGAMVFKPQSSIVTVVEYMQQGGNVTAMLNATIGFQFTAVNVHGGQLVAQNSTFVVNGTKLYCYGGIVSIYGVVFSGNLFSEVYIYGGVVYFSTGLASLHLPYVVLNGGSRDGTDVVMIDTLLWQGGSLAPYTSTIVVVYLEIIGAGTRAMMQYSTLELMGYGSVSGGCLVTGQNNVRFILQGGSNMTISSSGLVFSDVSSSGTVPSVIVWGVLDIYPSSTVETSFCLVNNYNITVNGGTLLTTGKCNTTLAGKIVLNNAVLQTSPSYYLIVTSSGSVRGLGTVVSPTSFVSGTLMPYGVNGTGNLTFSGNLVMTLGSTVTLSRAVGGESSRIVVTNDATIVTSLNLRLNPTFCELATFTLFVVMGSLPTTYQISKVGTCAGWVGFSDSLDTSNYININWQILFHQCPFLPVIHVVVNNTLLPEVRCCGDPAAPCRNISRALQLMVDQTDGIISLGDGVYYENNLYIDASTWTVTIVAETPYHATINCQGLGSAFIVNNTAADPQATLTISGINFVGCNSSYGGAISSYDHPSVSISDSTFHNNTADYGGAIYATNSTVLVNNSTFTNNTAMVNGGAVMAENTVLNMTDTTVVNNTAVTGGGGGGFFTGDTQYQCTNCIFANNTAPYGGDVATPAYFMKIITPIVGDVISGKHFNKTLVVGVVDQYDQVVTTVNNLTCTLAPTYDTYNVTVFNLTGDLTHITQNGLCIFNNLTATGESNNYTLEASCAAIGASVQTTIGILKCLDVFMEPEIHHVLCKDGNTGWVFANVTGGTPPFTYMWSDGQNTSTAYNLRAGNYSLNVTDFNSCLHMFVGIVVTEPEYLQSTIKGVDPFCYGTLDGNLKTNTTGGTLPYSYHWNTEATGPILGQLGAGTYYLNVTDANGCMVRLNYTLVQPEPLVATVDASPAVCGSNTVLTVHVSGGNVGPIYYKWDDPAQLQQQTVQLPPGNYTMRATDERGCTTTVPVTVAASTGSPLSAAATITKVPTCTGNGAAFVVPTGGQAPFIYTWPEEPSSSNSSATLAPGNWSVTVQDGNGCIATVWISMPVPISVQANASITNVLCTGAATGSIQVTILTGSPPFTYAWSDGSTSASISGKKVGIYSVVITDGSGCSTTLSNLEITQPPAMTVTASSTNASCANSFDGSLSATASGGSGAISFSWSSGQSTANVANVAPGTYVITATDGNRCSASATVTVGSPPAILANIVFIQVPCTVSEPLTASVNVTGGVGALTNKWSNGATTTSTTITAANFYVNVTDSIGCSVTVNGMRPAPISVDITANDATCFNTNDGSATAVVTGGSLPLRYLWSTGANTNSITALPPATYVVTVTDYNNCVAQASVTIKSPPRIEITVSTTPATCRGKPDGTAYVSVTGGSPPYSYYGYYGDQYISAADVTGNKLPPGTYNFTVVDNRTCKASVENITVGQPLSCEEQKRSCSGGKIGVCHRINNNTVSPICVMQAQLASHLGHHDNLAGSWSAYDGRCYDCSCLPVVPPPPPPSPSGASVVSPSLLMVVLSLASTIVFYLKL